jgi:hypothetical protein
LLLSAVWGCAKLKHAAYSMYLLAPNNYPVDIIPLYLQIDYDTCNTRNIISNPKAKISPMYSGIARQITGVFGTRSFLDSIVENYPE